jgi:signal transduction histidine kinase
MMRIRWPVALATLFFALLAWYLLYTKQIVDGLHRNEELITEVFTLAQELIQDPGGPETLDFEEGMRDAGRFDLALFELQGVIIQSGIPLIVMDAADSVLSVENLPFEADIYTPEGQEQVKVLVRRLTARGREPIVGAGGNAIHFGDTPELSGLKWIPYFLASGLMITVLIGFLVIRYQRRAEQEKAWTAMARELAHQLGTPISSLQGWLELLRLPLEERPGALDVDTVAGGIDEDLVRLERISHRFELIGRDPELEPLDIREIVRELEHYLQARLPRLTTGVLIVVDVPKGMPRILGNEVILSWALENVVKNALDAMAGRGGEIRLKVRKGLPGWVHLRIQDTGPGVDQEVRDKIFEPGVSGKDRGWGVGLTLSRRIIEVGHKGFIYLLDTEGAGATFEIRLPAAPPEFTH